MRSYFNDEIFPIYDRLLLVFDLNVQEPTNEIITI